jgi:replication factor C small subunit
LSNALLEFKYAPKTIGEMILSEDVRPKLEKALTELPNMVLYGPSGTGKGTFTDVLLTEKKLDFIKINCSDETGIDAIRDKVKTFAQSVGFGGIKIVYLNEADFLSMNAQAMLRDLQEQVQKYTRFIYCCNYIHKMLPELISRCQVIELSNPPAGEVVKRCWYILDSEGVKYDKKVVVEMVKSIWKRKPDIRKAIVTLKENIIDGQLSSNIRMSASEEVYGEILSHMKAQNPDGVRKALKSHQIDYTGMYKYIFDQLMGDETVFKSDAEAIIIIGEHDYRDNLVANREINFMAMYFNMLKKGIA